MMILMITALFAPLCGSLFAGLAGCQVARRTVYGVTIACMVIALCAAALLARCVLSDNYFDHYGTAYINLYHWFITGGLGFMVDRLTVLMMLLVTFISTLVHIYSIGYMAEEKNPAAKRFFCYMSLFTFMMLMLVTANNFLQLFFGWEGVGLVSYLLIGFYYTKESAVAGGLKAFLVNRVGDMSFILGMGALFAEVGSLDYQAVFAQAPYMAPSLVTEVCILLFIGAMAKSAQMPLHVWLPESMEGPTPISALIHAATMVTAGVFMVARMSPLFILSPTALSVVLIVGATSALFTGLLAFVEYDIKRIIAFSTMSQLGYMMAANGVSAFSASIFHLLTHGCFKALLFLAAGSIIVALHHEQDLRKMGNLRKHLPVTWIAFLLGALALAAIPPFSGYYSKEAIIEAVRDSSLLGAGYAYVCLLCSAFVTGYYIFRAYFMAFHGTKRVYTPSALRGESYVSIKIVLGVLAVPAVGLGLLAAPQPFSLKSFIGLPLYFSLGGILSAWCVVIFCPIFSPDTFFSRCLLYVKRVFSGVRYVLQQQYGFDSFNRVLLVQSTQKLSHFFYHYGDLKIVDSCLVEGAGRQVSHLSRLLRRLQSGYVYHYAFFMLAAVLVFLLWSLRYEG